MTYIQFMEKQESTITMATSVIVITVISSVLATGMGDLMALGTGHYLR